MFESYMKEQFRPRAMTLTGQGRVTLVPDEAVIRLGVQLTGTDLSAVQAQNAALSEAVLNALRQSGITDIRTFQYTIDKYFEYVDGVPVDRGFTVRNILEIRTGSTEQIGELIDTAVDAGANVVDLISFEVADPECYYQQALNLAIADAAEKARSISREFDIRVDPIPVSITENSSMPRPMQPFQRELAATPIVPGNVTIEASVTTIFTY